MTAADTVRDALELARGMVTQDADAQVRFEQGLAALEEIEEALGVYADGRHWAICRDDFDIPVVSWIGPGAIPETGKYRLPDPATTAKAVLGTGAPQGATTRNPGVGA